jgi:uncharacterized protein
LEDDPLSPCAPLGLSCREPFHEGIGMRSSDLDLIFVSGGSGSVPDHWQTRWRAKLPTARYVEQADWDNPILADWTENVIEACQASTRPVVLIAHSGGAIVVAHAATRLPNIRGAFLVAPPSDDALATSSFGGFAPTPRAKLPFPSMVVASRDDPSCPIDAAQALASDWGAHFVDAGAAGHIDVASGHGPWPEGLMSLARLLKGL